MQLSKKHWVTSFFTLVGFYQHITHTRREADLDDRQSLDVQVQL